MSAESKALKARTRLIRDTDAEIRSLLQQAAAEIAKILAGQPTDYQAWYLPQIQKQIKAALGRWGDEAADAAGNGQRAAWRGGVSLVDDVITEAIDDGAPVLRAVLPVLDDGQLRAMTSFLTSKIRDVTVGAADAINTELGMVVMGAKSPWDAIKAVQAVLEEPTTRRAGTIVRTDLARAYSTASQGRMAQWQADVPGLQKEWLKSDKLHPRENHVLMDGQIRAVDKPFALPGGGDIMYPHDPEAPAKETINCGCCAVPVVPGWKSMVPAKPEDDNHKGVPLSQVKMGADRLSAPPLRRALRDTRRDIANSENEVAVFFDSQGREVLRKAGESDHVRFTAAELKQVPGTVSLHNHPGIGSFSDADVEFAMSHRLAELHVVDQRFHYSMLPPKDGWDRALWTNSISKAFQAERDAAVKRFDAALAAGKIGPALYDALLDHVIWDAVAEQTGLRYKRRARGKNEF